MAPAADSTRVANSRAATPSPGRQGSDTAARWSAARTTMTARRSAGRRAGTHGVCDLDGEASRQGARLQGGNDRVPRPSPRALVPSCSVLATLSERISVAHRASEEPRPTPHARIRHRRPQSPKRRTCLHHSFGPPASPKIGRCIASERESSPSVRSPVSRSRSRRSCGPGRRARRPRSVAPRGRGRFHEPDRQVVVQPADTLIEILERSRESALGTAGPCSARSHTCSTSGASGSETRSA